jgi:hypothetical protein
MNLGAVTADTFPTANLHLNADPRVVRRPEAPLTERLPIWLSVLVATSCKAQSRGEYHPIAWQHDSGRAIYTNLGSAEERIEPLGVRLPSGKTVAVSWLPGETEYTVEVYRQ